MCEFHGAQYNTEGICLFCPYVKVAPYLIPLTDQIEDLENNYESRNE